MKRSSSQPEARRPGTPPPTFTSQVLGADGAPRQTSTSISGAELRERLVLAKILTPSDQVTPPRERAHPTLRLDDAGRREAARSARRFPAEPGSAPEERSAKR